MQQAAKLQKHEVRSVDGCVSPLLGEVSSGCHHLSLACAGCHPFFFFFSLAGGHFKTK